MQQIIAATMTTTAAAASVVNFIDFTNIIKANFFIFKFI